MFGAEAYANNAGRNTAEVREVLEEFEEPRERQGLGAAEDAADDVVLDDELEALGGAGGEGAAFLDGVEIALGGHAAQERRAKDVGRSYGVLNG